jgi:hypothetical protein
MPQFGILGRVRTIREHPSRNGSESAYKEGMTFQLIIPPAMPCGCGSNRPFGECHLKDGGVVVAAQTTTPPAPRTGKQTKKCYLKSTGDCDGPASAEHFVPTTVLSEISDTRVTFNAPGISFSAHPKSEAFAVKSLCKRHNSALHGLDTELGRFTRTLKHRISLNRMLTLTPISPTACSSRNQKRSHQHS